MGKAFLVAVVQQLEGLHSDEAVSLVVIRLQRDHKRLDRDFHRSLARPPLRRNADVADGDVPLVQRHHSVNLAYKNLQNTNSFSYV